MKKLTETKKIKTAKNRTVCLKNTTANMEIAIATSMSRADGEYSIDSLNGMIKIVRGNF